MEFSSFCALWREVFAKNAALFAQNSEKDTFSLADGGKNALFARLQDETVIKSFFALTERMLSVNEQMNLTAIKDPRAVVLLHYLDSLTVASLLPVGARVADIGTGAGFPALPLALAREDLSILAMDSTEKRVRYVEETAALLSLNNLSTLTARAEEVGHDGALRGKFDAVLGRAVAALPLLAELCLPLVAQGGKFIAMKGKRGREEAREGARAVKVLGGEIEDVRALSLSDGEESEERALIVVRKVRETPDIYPRPWAKMLKKPL